MVGPSPPPARPPRRRWPLLVALLVIAALLITAGLLLESRPPPRVEVSNLSLTSSDHVCGVRNQSLDGFVADPGATVREVLTIGNTNASSGCTVQSVATLTAGFGISGSSLPLAIGPSGHGNVTFDLLVPTSAYSGSVALDLE